jgi:hypothetical protein
MIYYEVIINKLRIMESFNNWCVWYNISSDDETKRHVDTASKFGMNNL